MTVEIEDEIWRSIIATSSWPVILDFYTPTCAPCKTLDTQLHTLDNTDTPVIICKINAMEIIDPVIEYRVLATPTLIVCREGIEIKRVHSLPTGLTNLVEWAHE